MATYTTTVPGLPGGPLVTDYPIKIKLIPKSRTLNRPGIKAERPRRSLQHGNGNGDSTAASEATYLYHGAGGRQASYHSSADDREVWIMVPIDEVTWQAADGAGPGNMSGISCEMVEDRDLWADPQRRERCIFITADFMGRVAARFAVPDPPGSQQHWDYNYRQTVNRHDCPNKLRHMTGAWARYDAIYAAGRINELSRTGGAVKPAPAPGDPWPYPDPSPVSALLETDVKKYDTAEGITVDDGTEFVFVADVVETIRDTPRLRYASSDEAVGPVLTKGTRFVAAWVFKFGETFFYLTSAPNWTRVRYADTKRISDAPLAGTP